MTRRRILYIQFTNPAIYSPLQQSSQMLADRGWEVVFLETGAVGTDHFRFPPYPRIRSLRMVSYRGGWLQKLHYTLYNFCVILWLIRWRPAWIYASDPLSCPIALAASYLAPPRVIYHEHDSPSGGPHSRWMRLVLSARSRLARRAAMCILPNRKRVELFSKTTGRREGVFTVLNCPSRKEVSSRPAQGWAPPLRLVFHGSIVPVRLPVAVLEAMSMLKGQVHLTVIGYETLGHLGYSALFRRRADDLGLASFLEWRGSMLVQEEMLARVHQADVGLAWMPLRSEDPNEKWMVGASVKVFQYLAGGLALLVSDLPEWKQAYVVPSYGLACDPEDPKSIARALQWFLEHPDQTRSMGEAGRQRILSEWNYEDQFLPVLQRLEETVR